MKPFGTELRVGIFTLAASGAIITVFFFLNPESFKGGDYKTYYTITDNAEGIVEKTHVRTNGVTVGRVAGISLLTNKTKIVLEIKKSVPIPRGSKVEIRSRGLLGDKYIEIVRSHSEEMTAGGEELSSSADSFSTEEVVALVGRIAQDVEDITQSLSDSLDGGEGRNRIETVMLDVEGLLKDLRGVVGDNRGRIASAVSHLEGAAQGIAQVVKTNKSNVERIVANLEEVSTSLNTMLGEGGRERFSNIVDKLDASLTDIKETTNRIKLVSAQVEQGKGTLGRLISDDSTIEKIESTLDSINEVLAPASKLQLEVDYHGEVRADKTSQHYFNLVFRTRQDKYYLLGITDFGERVVVTKRDSNPPSDRETEEREGVSYQTETMTDDKELRFNLQFAHRWYDVALRFGLFASKGGVASDFYLLDDRLRFTVEVFDWNSRGDKIRKVAHFRTYVKMVFLKHLNVIAGIDDPTRIDQATNRIRKNLNYFFGAGFSFTDNDLKGFLGTAALAL